LAGTYGQNCGQERGNVTGHLAASCDGREQCEYPIHHTVIGDPVYGCRKDYVAEWACVGSSGVHRAYAQPEAGFGSIVEIQCPTQNAPIPPLPSPGLPIRVVAGSYGFNCQAPQGNGTAHLAEKCNGHKECAYRVHFWLLGDPAYGCRKSYLAEWTCGDEPWLRHASAAPEAGYGSVVYLTCDREAVRKTLWAEGPRAAHGPIRVHSASYGSLCDNANGNATAHLESTCNGRWECVYPVLRRPTGERIPTCANDYRVEWTCGDDPDVLSASVPSSAGTGAIVVLHCP
jgi:hypothetical protein